MTSQVIETPALSETELERLRRLYRLAQTESPDPSTKNAASLHAHREEAVWVSDLVRSVNTFAVPALNKPERLERPLKYKWVEHAERHTLAKAARLGVATQGKILYACWAACPACANMIAACGISEVVSHLHPHMLEHATWADEVAVGDQIMLEAGVKLTRYTGKVGVQILFNGKLVEV